MSAKSATHRARSPLLLAATVAVAAALAGCASPASGPSAASLSRPVTIADTWSWDARGSRGFFSESYAGRSAGTRPPF
jgi:ABC-type glycerol-3-phosphate transport system substrate-binding protein